MVTSREIQFKIDYLSQHPVSELQEAEQEFYQAKDSWEKYTKKHEHYSKFAGKHQSVQSDRYKLRAQALNVAAQRLEQLKVAYAERGISKEDTLDSLQAELYDAQSSEAEKTILGEIELNLNYEQFVCIGCLDSSEVKFHSKFRSIEKSIETCLDLSKRKKRELLELAHSKIEQVAREIFLKHELSRFNYENLKTKNFSSRLNLAERYSQRAEQLGLNCKEGLLKDWLAIERQLFEEQELLKLQTASGELDSEFKRIQSLIQERFSEYPIFYQDLMSQLNSQLKKSKNQLKKTQETRAILDSMREHLDWVVLKDLTSKECENRYSLFLKSLEHYDELDTFQINSFYSNSLSKAETYRMLESSLLNLNNLASSEAELEKQFLKAKESIESLAQGDIEIRYHLDQKLKEVFREAKLKIQEQELPKKLWQATSFSERIEIHRLAQQLLPITGDSKASKKLRKIYEKTLIDISFSKMTACVSALKDLALDPRKEAKFHTEFEQAKEQIETFRLSAQFQKRRRELCQNKSEIIESNQCYREAVYNLASLRNLDFDRQRQAIFEIAQRHFRTLKTEKLLWMLGVSGDNNMSPEKRVLVLIYSKEALRLLKQEPTNRKLWTIIRLKREMSRNIDQLSL